MFDVLTPVQRKRCMSRIRGRDTAPELFVRKMLHSRGYRYRTHVKSLPGRPDIVLSRHHKIILVHGCFWHRHRCRFGRATPRTHADVWQEKFQKNRVRDRNAMASLRRLGWQVFVVWECQTRRADWLAQRLFEFLETEH
jgi:DNA mismatch endonuclease (patch repair protein)